MSINIRADISQVERMLTATEQEVLPRAIATTINRSIRGVRSKAVKLIAKDMGLTQKVVRQSTDLRTANPRDHEAFIKATGKRIPLIEFKARQLKKGVTYRAKGGKRKRIPNAFIARMKTGHRNRGVFVRKKGAARLPILERKGPSIPHVFLKDKLTQAMEDEAVSRWEKEFPHQVEFYLKRAGFA